MRLATLALALSLLVGTPAQALRCTEWKAMSQQSRMGAVQREFMEMLRSDWPRDPAVSAGRVEQCLGDASRAIRRDFDVGCEDLRVGTRALREILRSHIERCAAPSGQLTAKRLAP